MLAALTFLLANVCHQTFVQTMVGPAYMWVKNCRMGEEPPPFMVTGLSALCPHMAASYKDGDMTYRSVGTPC